MEPIVNDAPPSSDRTFGLLFVMVFIILAGYGFYRSWSWFAVGACLAAAFILLLLSVFTPGILAPLNIAWIRFGAFLGRIVNPIVLGLIYFGMITPVSLVTRVFGRDELKLGNSGRESYWIERNPPGPDPGSYWNQY